MIYAPKILVIKSELSQLELVERFVNEVFKEYKLAIKNFNKVYLCISEAVINSIEHGNKNDKNKSISIGIECNEKQMDIYIKDEGEGFNLNEIPDPTTNSNIRKESGRGIHIIKSISKKIEFNKEEKYIQFKIECSE